MTLKQDRLTETVCEQVAAGLSLLNAVPSRLIYLLRRAACYLSNASIISHWLSSHANSQH